MCANPSSQAADVDSAYEFANGFFALFRTSRLYAAVHPAYRAQAENFFSLFSKLWAMDGRAAMETIDGHLFVNGRRLAASVRDSAAPRFIIELLDEHELGGLLFAEDYQPEELDRLFSALTEAPTGLDAWANFLARLNILHIVPLQLKINPTEQLGELARQRVTARKTFVSAVSLVESSMVAVDDDKLMYQPAVKRVVRELVDQIMEDEAALLELSALMHYDEQTYAHSVNVAVLAIAFGKRLGLDKKNLARLGFGALFHDIGKTRVPPAVFNKSGKLNPAEWEQIRLHPIWGAIILISSRETDEYTAKAAEIAFMHHITFNLRGYPKLSRQQAPGISPMIIKICDAFNALSSARVYFKTPFSPHEVIRKMATEMQAEFDPLLLNMFIATVGIFPIGSLVLLNNGAIGIIYKTNPENIYRPKVRIIIDQDENKDGLNIVDLNEQDQETGVFRYNISRLLDFDHHRLMTNGVPLADQQRNI